MHGACGKVASLNRLTLGKYPNNMPLMTSTEALISRIADFCHAHGMAESTFGLKAVNDGKLVRSLRGGAGLTVRKLEQIEQFMQAYPKKSERAA